MIFSFDTVINYKPTPNPSREGIKSIGTFNFRLLSHIFPYQCLCNGTIPLRTVAVAIAGKATVGGADHIAFGVEQEIILIAAIRRDIVICLAIDFPLVNLCRRIENIGVTNIPYLLFNARGTSSLRSSGSQECRLNEKRKRRAIIILFMIKGL